MDFLGGTTSLSREHNGKLLAVPSIPLDKIVSKRHQLVVFPPLATSSSCSSSSAPRITCSSVQDPWLHSQTTPSRTILPQQSLETLGSTMAEVDSHLVDVTKLLTEDFMDLRWCTHLSQRLALQYLAAAVAMAVTLSSPLPSSIASSSSSPAPSAAASTPSTPSPSPPASLSLPLAVSPEVADLYRLRVSGGGVLGREVAPPPPRRPAAPPPGEPVVELTRELRVGCGGPQCVAVLLRPSATLESLFLLGCLLSAWVAQRRGQAAERLGELLRAGEEQRQRSEEAVRGLKTRLRVQESMLRELLQQGSGAAGGHSWREQQEEGEAARGSGGEEVKAEGSGAWARRKRGSGGGRFKAAVREMTLSEEVLERVVWGGEEIGGQLARKEWRVKTDDSGSPGVVNAVAAVAAEASGKAAAAVQERGVREVAWAGEELPFRETGAANSFRPGERSQRRRQRTKPSRAPTSWRPLVGHSPSPSPSRAAFPAAMGHSGVATSAPGGRTHVAPRGPGGVVVPDTNCYVRNLRRVLLLRKVPEVQTMVPVAVLAELDGLQQNSDPRTSFSARKAVRYFAKEMASGASWLRGQSQAELQKLKSTREREQQKKTNGVRAGGKAVTTSGVLRQWRHAERRSGKPADDEIIDCCLYFQQEGKYVTLLTDDKALQVKAMFQDLTTCSLEDYLEQHLPPKELRHLK